MVNQIWQYQVTAAHSDISLVSAHQPTAIIVICFCPSAQEPQAHRPHQPTLIRAGTPCCLCLITRLSCLSLTILDATHEFPKGQNSCLATNISESANFTFVSSPFLPIPQLQAWARGIWFHTLFLHDAPAPKPMRVLETHAPKNG